MPSEKKGSKGMMAEIKTSTSSADAQKMCKWALIIGVPTVLLLVVIGIVVGVFVSGN